MDFDFTEDQVSLRDAVARWVEKGFGFERRLALARAGGRTRGVWQELAELGLTGLAVPEDNGGMGFGPVEAMVVMEELGRGLVNAPYAMGALVAPALLRAAPWRLLWAQCALLGLIGQIAALLWLGHEGKLASYALWLSLLSLPLAWRLLRA